MELVLYTGTKNASSWAMRAWLSLKEQNLSFQEVIVDIRRPQRFDNLEKIKIFSPPGAIPVLLVNRVAIYDSLAIMEFASEAGSTSLLPSEQLKRAEARALLAWQHSGLSNICWRLSFESAFYPDKRKLYEEELCEIYFLFDYLEGLLSRSNGEYLFGRLSLADLNLVPTVLRIFRHSPDFTRYPRVEKWGSLLLARDSVREWLENADRLEHVWYDEYLHD